VIDFKEYKDYSFLLTSYLEGIMLDDMLNINKHIISAISQNLIQYLYSIHSVDIEPFFGWIGDEESPDCSTIEEYLYKEMKRFKKSYVKEFDEKYVENLMSIGENAIENIYRLSIEKPVLLWYDINRKNILIREKGDSYEISGFLDPGGARFGLREWDIAFLKINFCLNDEEFFYILDEYMKIYPALNMSLLKTFEVFVELDNLALQVEDQCIYDIPRNSMFKETLLHLQDKYSN
jgi:aminoglycoside phosphotransferase (APT) family kinase protein